jgi:hypothetical protein
MSTFFSLQTSLRRSLAAVVVAGSAIAVAGAQTPVQESAASAQPVNFATSAAPQLGSGSGALFSSSSSSSSSLDEAGTAAANTNLASLEKNFNLPNANAQYGRRRYGAPRYRGGNTNPDGSPKYTFYAGAGFTLPVGNNSSYLTTSYGIQVGVGRNLNKHFGVNAEFDYDHFGLTNDAVNYYAGLFGDPTNTNGFGGNNHIWSFSLQPVFQIYSGEGLGAYVTGGVGFYHKVTNFTLPTTQFGCFGYYCGYITENVNIDHYTSNAPGFDGGIGLTYKFSRFANEKFFAEVRYVYVDSQYKQGINAGNINTYTGSNLFPQNSLTTSYIPVKFGLRF